MAYRARNLIINGMKKCNICGKTKPISEYYPHKKGYRGHCKKCNYNMCKVARAKLSPEKKREYWQKSWAKPEFRERKYKEAKERLKRIKQKSIDYLGGKCMLCGYDKCIEALEFHHKDPFKKEKTNGQASVDRRRSFETNKKELDKCILLCANCHREVHYNEKNSKNPNSL